ncbi:MULTISPECIES: FtsK/SpoIIIE family DNA translocase [Aequorivita]|uniref:DNA translocase FtsK 4TM domain-containing protein n=1 Tax=Aequorivita iocasae TaxID=2803865 RepID=A0ABX7DQN9_9FLAO|nr:MULTISPECIES: DNA translocase FtsK [Aequorivita]QQX76440.1 DNA translocase FtsK 4TM domain-containing protein [Aequorivita iocasae]UCA55912.1 DNA translocase FtsK [Aequorivita sp. F7]
MAKKKNSTTKTPRKKISFSLSKQQKILLGSFLFLLGLALMFSFVSYFFTWQADQSEIGVLAERELQTKNWLNKFGANVAHFFIYDGFGISAFIFAFLVTLTGIYYFFDYAKKQLAKFWFWGLLLMLWISVFFGFFGEKTTLFSGIIGFETNDLMQDYLGLVGAMLVMIFILIVYLVVRLKLTPEMAIDAFKSSKKQIASEFVSDENKTDHKTSTVNSEIEDEDEDDIPEPFIEEKVSPPPPRPVEKIILKSDVEGDVEMEVEQAADEEEIENLSDKLVKDFGEFDPKLELSNYKFPSIELLRDHTVGAAITIDQEELEENKNRIVETLSNYKIGIANIKATVGPTVTLYEIVPDAGIRISKIKNLEDDIALSLSALGIRIIAPIPGRGTIGIEVPNKNAKIVSMRSVIASAKFQNAEMELPIAFGKTISNETFVVDLAKMPHMLMAGATGQGKSVGLNAVLTSLLYKKHPAEVKFVLVDPKKVELTLFNKIERHYLAKLPDTEEAIITDTAKVINTLNSLCIEMDTRYDLLKDAMVRNIKEYNTKFKNRKLNPNEGHRFLPYIVLVIDEFADLIMTAGKEVETPIARLAQLARAIGIHLIIATQRPSVNVITGIIKANFPARIAFRVTSKIDSRTILDNSGADQLIGRGDMLYTQGNELTRIQCAFVDTPEVADITEFIGSQKAYPDAHLLPEYVGEEGGTTLDIDIEERDKLFREAAEVLVIAQQGSASLLQRKLKLGYNRAGRIIDQMEAAGIVGPFEGSKARQVLVPTIDALNQLLDNEQNDN